MFSQKNKANVCCVVGGSRPQRALTHKERDQELMGSPPIAPHEFILLSTQRAR